jgi:hypothetical protein
MTKHGSASHFAVSTILSRTAASCLALAAALGVARAEVPEGTIESLSAPDSVETSIGTLEFKDGAPTADTAQAVFDALAFTRALNVYNNSFRGASALGFHKGFQSIGADYNDVIITSELLDSTSLFLTGNADTVYYLSVVDLSKGPMVIEQPSDGVGTINDMWFSWIIDVGGPGPDRGKGGKYLIVGPDYDGPLPEGGYFVTRGSTCWTAARSPPRPRPRPGSAAASLPRSAPTCSAHPPCA